MQRKPNGYFETLEECFKIGIKLSTHKDVEAEGTFLGKSLFNKNLNQHYFINDREVLYVLSRIDVLVRKRRYQPLKHH